MTTLEILEALKPAVTMQDYDKLKTCIVEKRYAEAETIARIKQGEIYKILKDTDKDPWENPYYRSFHQLIANLACANVKEQLIYGDDDDDECEY